MNEPTVSASDIARLAGVGRAAVSNWRRRYEDFPAPVDGTSSNPRFPLTQVERWLAEQGKLQPGAEWERLWGLVEAYRGSGIDLPIISPFARGPGSKARFEAAIRACAPGATHD